MTHEEFVVKMEALLAEENSDFTERCELSRKAESLGLCEASALLWHMAKDERSHARYLEHIIECEEGVDHASS